MNKENLNLLVDTYTTAMNEVNRRINVIMNEKVHQELTSDQFGTLRFLQMKQPCTSSDIAHEFSIGKSAVTAQINRLVERNLINRTRDEQDRRIIYLTLTEDGKKLINAGTKKLYDVLGDILSEFKDEEISCFIESLEKLARIIPRK